MNPQSLRRQRQPSLFPQTVLVLARWVLVRNVRTVCSVHVSFVVLWSVREIVQSWRFTLLSVSRCTVHANLLESFRCRCFSLWLREQRLPMELVASTVSGLSVGGVFDVCGVCPRVFLKDELTSCPDLVPYCSYFDWLREKCEYMSG